MDREFFSGEDKDPYDIDFYADEVDDESPHGGDGRPHPYGGNRTTGKRNPLNMMGEDTMIMIGDHTDLMTNTCAMGVEKSAPSATEVPTHLTRVDVTQPETTVVILDS